MNKQQKLEVIYEAMADKTLINGCIISAGGSKHTMGDTRHYDDCGFSPEHISVGGCGCCAKEYAEGEYKIIGHPVRIGDVLDWFDRNNPSHLWGGNGVINGEIIIRHWNHLRLPINDQSEECIDFVYSLII